jgi:glycosyltransferase involved in cell wall biosynthesis
LEVIVVNDGSFDGTINILHEYENKIILVYQENKGVVEARKVGALKARGKYIKFLDADDIIPPNSMESLLNIARDFPNEVLLGRAVEFNEATKKYTEKMYTIGERPHHLSPIKYEFLLTQATHSGLWLIPRLLFENFSFFPKEKILLGEEYYFSMRIIETKMTVRFVDLVVYNVRVHNSTSRLSKTIAEDRHIAQAKLIEDCLNFIIEEINHPSPKALHQIAAVCWSRGRECIRINSNKAANSYFRIAKKARPNLLPTGSFLYRILCNLFGPFFSENLLEKIKTLNFSKKNKF